MVVHGEFLNLAALRAAAQTKPLSNQTIPALYNRFHDPLPSDIIAPLCGNGQLDNYQMTTPNSEQSDAASVIFVNELCDYGNRLDGDGCAADCASMDALTSPCPLAIDTGGEEIVAMALNTYIFAVFTPTRMIRMESVDLKVLSIDPFTIGPVVAAWQQDRDFFVYGAGQVWMPLNSQADIPGLVLPTSVPYDPLPVADSPTGIVLVYRNAETLQRATYLVTAAGEIVDVGARRVTNWTNSSMYAAGLWNVEISQATPLLLSFVCTMRDGSQVHFVLDTGSHTVLPNLVHLGPPSDDDPSSPGYPWIYLFSKALRKGMRPVTSDVSEYASYGWNKTRKELFGISSFMVGPFSITYPKFSARDILTGMHQLGAIRDPSFTNGLVAPAALCNGTNASCILDVPLCYDVLAPNAYAAAATSTGGPTLFTALDTASRSSKTWEETVAKANLNCSQGESVKQILIHADSQALWILRGSQIYEVGRRGTQVRAPSSSGQCVPSMSGACMPGYWSWSNLACKSCASFDIMGDDGGYPRLVAHAQQCANAAPQAMNSSTGRRRLLQQAQIQGEGIEMVVVTNVLTNASAATALFAAWGTTSRKTTTAGGAWKYAYACQLSKYVKADPFQVLRALKATAQPNVTDFLSPATRMVPYADPMPAQGLPAGLMVGLIAGGGLLLVFLVMCCAWYYMHYHYQPKNQRVLIGQRPPRRAP